MTGLPASSVGPSSGVGEPLQAVEQEEWEEQKEWEEQEEWEELEEPQLWLGASWGLCVGELGAAVEDPLPSRS